MGRNYFRFKHFDIKQEISAFRVGTDGVLLGAVADLSAAGTILDIGTGTGLLTLMAAQRSEALITAIEPHRDSFTEATSNFSASKWSSRIRILNTGLREFCEETDEKFDVIITNPPFFRNSLKTKEHASSIARHAESLTSDLILDSADTLLAGKGTLQLILPYTEGCLFIAEASGYRFYCNSLIKVKPNPSGRIIRLIMKFSRQQTLLSERFLTIETGERHHYTSEYIDLTKDFYLDF